MLTKFILAGLIPGMMAKPIAPRHGANMEKRGLENGDYYRVKPLPISEEAVSPLPSLGPTTTPAVFSTKPATLLTPISTFPVAPPPKIQSVAPAAEYAVATPPAYPATVPSAAVEIEHHVENTPIVPVVVPSVAPGKNDEYWVKSRPVITHAIPSEVPISHTVSTVSKVPSSAIHVSHTHSSVSHVHTPPAHVSHAFTSVTPSMPAQHEYAVAETPVYSHVVEAVTSSMPVYTHAIPSKAPSMPAQHEYAVAETPVYSHVIEAVTSSMPAYAHAMPSKAPSMPAQHEYAVAETPVYSHFIEAVTSSMPAYAHAIPSKASSMPAQHEYAVAETPVYSHVVEAVTTSMPAQHEYAVEETPAFSHVVEAVATSVPAQHQYAVADASAYSHAVAPVASPVQAYGEEPLVHASAAAPAQAHAVTSVAAYGEEPLVHASAAAPAQSHAATSVAAFGEEPLVHASATAPAQSHAATSAAAYGAEEPAVHASALPSSAISSSPVEAVYAVETAPVEHAVPATTPDATGPPKKTECVGKCHPQCQKGDKQCMAACLEKCHAAKMLSTDGHGTSGKLLNNNKDGEAHDDKEAVAHAKVAGKPAKDAPAFAAGTGFKSFEACVKSCKGKFQQADIVFPISQGKSDCAEACAAYASEGAGITAKRAVEPVAGALQPAAPALVTGAGYASFEACMKDCHSKFQSTNIVFDISQGKESCKKSCAQYTKNAGGLITTKRAVEPVAGALRPAAPALTTGAGYVSYEACMKDCNGRWQSANIVFDVAQGKKSCKAACASYESNGSGVVVTREAAQATEKVTRDFPFEGEDPFEKNPKEGPFTKTPDTVAGASTSTYEACMHGCGVKLQSADIAFEVEQGDTECATRCARYSSNGAGVSHV